ncbi:efflux RND transporter permease subunit [Marinobacterium weihaiense]|uniref:Efflux RND transporter permease subunit n=1 Tax=Marinobacterium weihaiense TaxID=2851016 RepID=A0ABS6MAX7_9GAMM|nr:efflux RND transporter permease subunit [Marinobacterium weihaiense]MBV0933451.1 efflux RND transporter permease subunit [Marinobacterium weihaiense]
MNLTEYAIRQRVISWMCVLLLLTGGVLAFFDLGQLEDPEFTVKEAIIAVSYPGATALEVEEEVTLPVEMALQQLTQVKTIESISSAGLAQITVEMKSTYREQELRQIWDEMRRKLTDLAPGLPPGVGPMQINDDFGDVFGIFLALTGDGFDYRALEDYADFLRRELVLVEGVSKVSIGGQRQQQIIVEVDRNRLAAMQVSPQMIQQAINSRSLISNAGSLRINGQRLQIRPEGSATSAEQLNNLLLGQTGGQLVYLSDVAEVYLDYVEPPTHLYRFNGQQALTLGVSFTSGVNVVEVGQRVRDRLEALDYRRPVGMSLDTVYDQPREVDTSVNDFLISLAQAIAIVVLVLLLTMGARSGLLMSLVLLLTILGTFIIMNLASINLHRVSLGALIIALGMLVDNAIVITEGILINLQRGYSRLEAAVRIVSHTRWPLLGATLISITAFAPIGLSPDATGEFTGSLFWVLFISLLLSWLLAITLTPFLASVLFREQPGDQPAIEPYQSLFYRLFGRLLGGALRWRWLTLSLALGLLIASVAGFKYVKQGFFPDATLPLVQVDYWLPQGSDIRTTEADIARIEQAFLQLDGVTRVTSTLGRGAERFMLTYAPERQYASYAQLLVQTDTSARLEAVMPTIRRYLQQHYPQAHNKLTRISIGPTVKSKVEARISGPDAEVLRQLGQQMITEVFDATPGAVNIRHDWRERTAVIVPRFDEAEGRRLGITQADLASAIARNAQGQQAGLIRDGSRLLPVLLRPPQAQRQAPEQLESIPIFSQTLQRWVDAGQVITAIDVGWEDPLIMRRDRKRTLTVMADPSAASGLTAAELFSRIRPAAEALPLPEGYSLDWGGEYEVQQEANQALFAFVPFGLLVMVIITVLLFGSVRQTLVIWLTVPMAVIGVTIGLLTMHTAFAFTALLGMLSLSGMLIKNSIVLVEEIKRLHDEEDCSWHDAIETAAVSRLRPVTMAALTTILGMLPLLPDAFFRPLAVTIMFGLGFATLLTLVVVPVLFALLYRIKY